MLQLIVELGYSTIAKFCQFARLEAMLKIRLQRVGRKNDPSFRIVVTDHHKDSQSGKFIEVLGSYNARRGRPQIKADRVKRWLAVGAQASDTVHNLLVDQKMVAGKKINVLPKRKAKVTIKEAVLPVASQ